MTKKIIHRIRPSFIVGLMLLLLMTALLVVSKAQAQNEPEKILVPIGGGDREIYADFSEIILTRSKNNLVRILVLPTAYSSDPFSITDSERTKILLDAEIHRANIEVACRTTALPETICRVSLVPLFVRSDAENPDFLQALSDDLTAIYFLDGDQRVAMQVLANTIFEKAMGQAYQNGAIIAGAGAGGSIQSSAMVAGYSPNYNRALALNFGAADLWSDTIKRGLSFGTKHAIVDQKIFQDGQLGRLLNVIVLPGVPHIGIGVDNSTGVQVRNEEIVEKVFGLYPIAILDAETYHAANITQYSGSENFLSIHNVLIHLLSSGDFSFDLIKRQHSLAETPSKIERSIESLKGPTGSGGLFLGGDLSESLIGNPSITRFINQCGGTNARIAIIAAGYGSDLSAKNAAGNYAAALNPIDSEIIVVDDNTNQTWQLPDDISGIILIGDDQEKISTQYLMQIKQAWLNGIPVLADNAAAAIIGAYYTVHKPAQEDTVLVEAETQKSLLFGNTILSEGLGFLDITIEPQLLEDNRWGLYLSLAYNHPQLIAIGLNKDTVIEISPGGAIASGSNVTFVLDMRFAALDLGSKNEFVIANGLMDVFAPGEIILFINAESNISPIHAPTPILHADTTPTTTTFLTATQTLAPQEINPSVTITQRKVATRTLRPTNTPPIVPPAADPVRSNWMILIAILAVCVVFIGVWINFRRVL